MIQKGTKVKVHYTGKLDDGQVFDSSYQRNQPIEFQVGENQVIPGFENAVADMSVGDKKTVIIEPEQGYGPVREDLFVELPKSQVPQDVEVGSQLQGQNENGPVNVVVKEIKENTVVLDANHQMAGKNMNFELELVEIVE